MDCAAWRDWYNNGGEEDVTSILRHSTLPLTVDRMNERQGACPLHDQEGTLLCFIITRGHAPDARAYLMPRNPLNRPRRSPPCLSSLCATMSNTGYAFVDADDDVSPRFRQVDAAHPRRSLAEMSRARERPLERRETGYSSKVRPSMRPPVTPA